MNLIIMLLKKTAKLLFNRIFYVALALLIQLGWLLILVWQLAAYSKYISFGITVISILSVLWIVNRRINPSYKLGWTMLIMAVPIFGLVLYILFGKSRIAQEMQEHYTEVKKESVPYLKQDPKIMQKITETSPSAAVQSKYIHRYSGFPVYENTTAEYFQVGDDMFPVLVKELEQAKHYIYIEYFIINDGVMWRTILDILEKKAAAGVDVRIIYDGFGCLTTLPHRYDKVLREKGIQCRIFNPFRPMLNIVQNNRDHRKICVIDGNTGFTGGINLSDEYINQKERFGHWKDTAVMLKGEAVWSMTVMFLHMWSVVSGIKNPLEHEPYLPHVYHPERFEGSGFIQPFSDTPLDGEVLGENIYLNIINKAKRYVYICTPYLIIDNEMMTALCLAAKGGVDVRIMTPGIPDKKMVFLLTQSYYEQLLESGVKIYEYQPGFLHAKSFVCDDEIAVVGTINLDYRSLFLHFENNALFCNASIVQKVKEDIMATQAQCRTMRLGENVSTGFFHWLLDGVLRIFSPLC